MPASNTLGEAFTLLMTEPLIPIEALARAYSSQRVLSLSVTVNESLPARQKMERPA
jgi:hypothetical protein